MSPWWLMVIPAAILLLAWLFSPSQCECWRSGNYDCDLHSPIPGGSMHLHNFWEFVAVLTLVGIGGMVLANVLFRLWQERRLTLTLALCFGGAGEYLVLCYASDVAARAQGVLGEQRYYYALATVLVLCLVGTKALLALIGHIDYRLYLRRHPLSDRRA